MAQQSVLAQLLEALHAGEVSLADFVGRLKERGPVGASQHAQELQLLDDTLRNGKIEPAVLRAIVA
jgi:hypothetical protein